jgi:hypothetical protein
MEDSLQRNPDGHSSLAPATINIELFRGLEADDQSRRTCVLLWARATPASRQSGGNSHANSHWQVLVRRACKKRL